MTADKGQIRKVLPFLSVAPDEDYLFRYETGPEGLEHRLQLFGVRGDGQHHLVRRPQGEGQGAEKLRKACRKMAYPAGQGTAELSRPVFQVRITCYPGQLEEVEHGDRVAGRQGAVIGIFLAEQEFLAVIGREKEPSLLLVPEVRQLIAVESKGLGEDAGIECGFVKLDESPDQEGVIVQICRNCSSPSR